MTFSQLFLRTLINIIRVYYLLIICFQQTSIIYDFIIFKKWKNGLVFLEKQEQLLLLCIPPFSSKKAYRFRKVTCSLLMDIKLAIWWFNSRNQSVVCFWSITFTLYYVWFLRCKSWELFSKINWLYNNLRKITLIQKNHLSNKKNLIHKRKVKELKRWKIL